MQLKKDLMTKEAETQSQRTVTKSLKAAAKANGCSSRCWAQARSADSVEEWVYLKQRRDKSSRLREEQRYEEERQEQGSST